MARVPLREVLPRGYLSVEGELRTLANQLDSHPLAANRTQWRWHPDQTEPPPTSTEHLHLLLVDTTITSYKTRDDWLELTLGIAWQVPPKLTVDAAVEVACWCPQDHNMHRVRQAQCHAVNSHELTEAVAAGTAMLMDVLASGPSEPHPWRVQAGLPDAPGAIR